MLNKAKAEKQVIQQSSGEGWMNNFLKSQHHVVKRLFKILKKSSLDGDETLPQLRNINSAPFPLQGIYLCYLIIKDTMKDEKHNSLEKNKARM